MLTADSMEKIKFLTFCFVLCLPYLVTELRLTRNGEKVNPVAKNVWLNGFVRFAVSCSRLSLWMFVLGLPGIIWHLLYGSGSPLEAVCTGLLISLGFWIAVVFLAATT